ncbi:MAG: hypothetical protein V3R80_13105 [Candidatus Tectomicrobia bacterium]
MLDHGSRRCLSTGIAILAWCVAMCGSVPAAAQRPACQDSWVRFLTQMYLTGSYCTCPAQHREMVTEQGGVRRAVRYTLPGIALRQRGPLPDLSRVFVRVWGKIIDGPGGVYTISVRLHQEGHTTHVFSRRIDDIRQDQEFEITRGPQDRLLLHTRIPHHLQIEGHNANLQPPQQLTVQGRVCFYLVSPS